MSYYVFVSADFPNVTSEQREKIYECLIKKNWRKMTCVSTSWQAYFETDVSYDSMKRITISDFDSCYIEATKKRTSEAKLAFQITNNSYETHNC